MRIWLFSIWYNEIRTLPYFLRHYAPWVDRLIIYVDLKTNDGTLEELKKHAKVEVRAWPHNTGLDDEQFIQTCNHWPNIEGRKNGLDWVGFVDADELLWHPNPKELLNTTSTDIIRSKGYALINPGGWPVDDGRQIYEQVQTGVVQENHSKFLIWRPGFDICHHHGRHDTPAYGGRIDRTFRMRNFHLHHLGGVEGTRKRNDQNVARAHDKKFAWNYSEESEQKRYGGTVNWVRDVIEGKQLISVMEDKL